MTTVPVEFGLILASILFTLGLLGLLVRRNLIFMLISVEVMLNAAALLFILGGAFWQEADGQVMVLFILTMAAAEVALGLALILAIFRRNQNLDADQVNQLQG